MVLCNKCNNEETESYSHAKCDGCGTILCVNCSGLSASEYKGITLKKRSPCVKYHCKECLQSNKDDANANLSNKIVKYLETIQKTVNGLKTENAQLRSIINNMSTKMDDISSKLSSTTSMIDNVNADTRTSEKSSSKQVTNTNGEAEASNSNNLNNKDKNQGRTNKTTLSQLQQALNSVTPSLNSLSANPLPGNTNVPMQIIPEDGNAQLNVGLTGAQPNNTLQGITDAHLTGVPVKKWFYIGHVSTTSSCQVVEKFIRDRTGMTNSEFISVTQLSSNESSCSFKIGIEGKYGGELQKEDFWPQYISCKNFLFKNHRNNQPNNQRNSYGNSNYRQNYHGSNNRRRPNENSRNFLDNRFRRNYQ